MTATLDSTTTTTVPAFVGRPPVDLYLDIHKGLRAALFSATQTAGRIDPSSTAARAALAEQVAQVAWLLDSHAEHEDVHCQPVIEEVAPELAAVIAETHPRLERRVAGLRALADAVATVDPGRAAAAVDTLYLELALFTGDYLVHQDFEERHVMPAIAAALPPEAVGAVEMAIVGSIPPDEMATSLSIMLPAMNVDDRTQLLGGIRAGAPAEVFTGICALAQSVLTADDWTAVATRLDVD